MELSPEQTARLRELLAVPDGDPDPTGDDVIAVLEAEEIVAEHWRWHNFG